MQRDCNHYGPEFLDDLADRVGSDNPGDAIAFRQAAANWNNDQEALAQAQASVSDMQRRLDAIARTAAAQA